MRPGITGTDLYDSGSKKANTFTPKLYTLFGKKNIVLYEMIHIKREHKLTRDILFRVCTMRTKRQGEERDLLFRDASNMCGTRCIFPFI